MKILAIISTIYWKVTCGELMSLQLLCVGLEGVSPEAKFFLLRFLQYYRLEQPVVFSSIEMVKRFGIPDKTIKKALDELCGRKYLIRSSHLTGTRGRPKHEFVAGEELVKTWSRTTTLISHTQIIEKLLEVTPERQKITKPESPLLRNGKGGKGQAQKFLTNTRKLLLCTLLAKADQFGVVRDLGMSELASLVGISKEQLRWHLKILKGSQFLFDYVPGTVVRGIEGKLRSIFILPTKWVRVDASYDPILLLERFEALSFFKRALQLVYALEAIHGPLKSSCVIAECKGESSRWALVYKINKVEVEEIIDCALFLRELGDSDVTNYRRLCSFLCEIVAILIADSGLFDSEVLSEDEVTKLVYREGRKRKLNIAIARTKVWNMKSLRWFSRLVLRLYRELRERLTKLQAGNEKSKLKLMSINPIVRGSSVLLHLSVESDQSEDGYSSQHK